MAEINRFFETRLDVQPPLSDEQLAGIPAKRGVVLLAGEGGEPVVMITAADMRSRTRSRLAEPHEGPISKTPDLRLITRAIFFTRCESRFETDWRFLEISRRIWPRRYTGMTSLKPPWFVHLALSDAYPHFARSRDVFAGAGLYLGPFASGPDARKFIEALQDAFDLCRGISCLRRAPTGPRCAYAEMGRCVSPADGTISMDAYRLILQEAADFAAGRRRPMRDRLREKMTRASTGLKFEQAEGFRKRLERLDVFEGERYRHVAPAGRFGYVLLQRGRGVHEFRVFLAHRGAIEYAGPMAYPLQPGQLAGVPAAMRRLTATENEPDAAGRLRMALVARTLFDGTGRMGLALPWRPGLAESALAEAVEAGLEVLNLRPNPVRAKEGHKSD